MATIDRGAGVRLVLAEGARVTELREGPPEAEPARGAGRAAHGRGPVPMPASGTPREDVDPVVESMRAQEMELVDAFAVEHAGARPTRRGVAGARDELIVDLASDEEAVVLLETEGLYEWRFADRGRSTVTPSVRRGPVVEAQTKQLVFDLTPPAEEASRARTRGPVGDFLRKKVRTYVLKFVAGLALRQGIKFLERKVRRGLIVMDSDDPGAWRRVEDMSAFELPKGRPARILLFVHGTFSSTLGSFGALGGSPWGRELLQAVRSSYDLVIGYDHATLSDDPLENATDLLARLERGRFSLPPVIDALSYSRGALVLRSLIEYLLPGSRLGARVRRAIFVGGTNGGTRLAEPDNWARLADLYTTIAAAAGGALSLLGTPVAGLVLRESIGALGALVKHLATAAVTERKVPGLAAMEPDGRFVRELNATQPGQPGVVDSIYSVVTSDFDIATGDETTGLTARVRRWIVDTFADSLLREANDLVVHTAAMSAIDPDAGAFVKDTLAFGRNPHVYHTVYFTRPEVARAVATWLDLAAPPATMAVRRGRPAADLPAIADSAIHVASSEDIFADVMADAEREEARYVVLHRSDAGSHHYAFRREELAELQDELTELERMTPISEALTHAPELMLHEWSASREVSVDTSPDELAIAPAPEEGLGATARRSVLLEGSLPRAVVEPADRMPSLGELGEGRPRHAAAGARRGRRATPVRPAPAAGAAEPARQPELVEAPVPTVALPTTASFFFSASMSGHVAVGRTEALSVIVSRDEIERIVAEVAARAHADVDLERRLTIQIVGKTNFDVVGEDRVVLDPSTKRRFELLFEVKATDRDGGEGEIWVLVRQGAEVLATLVLKPRIGGARGRAGRRVTAAAEAAPTGGGRYPVLQIFERQNGSAMSYHFALDMGDAGYVGGDSPPLRADRGAYVADLYKDIEDRWVANRDDIEAFEAELRSFGGTLFDALVPPSVQSALWDVRDGLRAIQVVSEEPFIPWELVLLKEPGRPGGPPRPVTPESRFFAELGLVRWLHNRGPAPREIRVRDGHAFHLVPNYPHPDYKLPAAQREIPFLTREMGTRPAPTDENGLRRLLTIPGAVDLLHFSGHGEADAQTGTASGTRAEILLQGRVQDGEYLRAYFRAVVVQQHARLTGQDGNRPLVVLNACQIGRANWHLTSIGGFAEAFIRAGTGAFVGTLWSVGDSPAKEFTEALYRSLLDGSTLVQATLDGRRAAQKAGEATWLAYVVYGHPEAIVKRETVTRLPGVRAPEAVVADTAPVLPPRRSARRPAPR